MKSSPDSTTSMNLHRNTKKDNLQHSNSLPSIETNQTSLSATSESSNVHFPSLKKPNGSDHILFTENDEMEYTSIYADNRNRTKNLSRRKISKKDWGIKQRKEKYGASELKLAQTYAFDRMVAKHQFNHGYAPRMRHLHRPVNPEVMHAAKATHRISKVF